MTRASTSLSIHSLVVQSQGRTILVDTCVGDREIEGLPGLRGPAEFPDRLAEAGFPVDVDRHGVLHPSALRPRRLEHPPARTVVGCRPSPTPATCSAGPSTSTGWPRLPVTTPRVCPTRWARVVAAGLADLVEPDHRVTDEVRFVPSHGHSPGHVSVLIESARRAGPHHRRRHPPPGAVGRARLGHARRLRPGDGGRDPPPPAGRARWPADGPAGTLILGTHYAAPSAGRIVGSGDDWRFVAEPG